MRRCKMNYACSPKACLNCFKIFYGKGSYCDNYCEAYGNYKSNTIYKLKLKRGIDILGIKIL